MQVISPMRKGPAGTTTLNPMLQALLNPARPGKAELLRHHSAAHAAAAAASSTASSDDGGGQDGAAAQHPDAKVFRVGDRVIQQVRQWGGSAAQPSRAAYSRSCRAPWCRARMHRAAAGLPCRLPALF